MALPPAGLVLRSSVPGAPGSGPHPLRMTSPSAPRPCPELRGWTPLIRAGGSGARRRQAPSDHEHTPGPRPGLVVLTVEPLAPPRPSESSADATPERRRAFGRALRAEAPLDGHAEFRRPESAVDPLTLLLEQGAARLPELLPIRYGRMARTPFTYYRGAARVMAADLSHTARSGLGVQMGGDAHLVNFGFSGSPERRLVFDANDFDETLPGPFEYDVKRLVASLEVAGRDNGYPRKARKAIAVGATARYRTAMAEFAESRDIDVWYSHVDSDELQQRLAPLLDADRRKRLARALA